MSDLFPRLNKRLVRRLLHTGARFTRGQKERGLIATASALERLGLVDIRIRQVVKCADPGDEDYGSVPNQECTGEIELDQSPLACPVCGRRVNYPGVHKQVFEHLYVTVSEADVLDYLVRALAVPRNVVSVEPVDDVAIRVHLIDGRTLILAVVDYTGVAWQARGPDAAKAHAYLIASPVSRPAREHLERAYHIELADILSRDPEWLANALDSAAQPRHTAFIGYSPRDASFVDRLIEDLAANGVGVWLERWKMRANESVSKRIRQTGLEESDYLLVALSNHSVSSSWLKEGLTTRKMGELASKNVDVLPMLCKDCDIPPSLQHMDYIDLRADHYEQGLRALLKTLAPAAPAGSAEPLHWGKWRPETLETSGERGALRRALLLFITKHFDEDELKTLCFDLDVAYEELPARVRKSKARELILYLEKRGRLSDLIALVREERPVPFANAKLPL
ncbi:MAG: TIR domain-containing protein [Anaerolineales bacterium]|nr:TIR domain-containing protein [Anaerolineales bacterium]